MNKKPLLCITLLAFFSYYASANISDNNVSQYTPTASRAIGYTSTPPAFKDPTPEETQKKRSRSNQQTTTYIKCVYRIKPSSVDATDPATNWVWAKSPLSPENYAQVSGYWRDDRPIKNMFYTNAKYVDILNTCKTTLRDKKLNTEEVTPYAGSSFLSWYYIFWNQGSSIPSVNVSGVNLDRIVAFGDSLSDTINLYNATFGMLPKSSTWYLGHFSNGKVWHEYLSSALHIPSYVWATANAEASDKTVFPSLETQLHNFKEYMAFAKGYDIKKTLFTVLFGGNDFIGSNKTPDSIINSYREGLVSLADLGAKQVAILNLPDFSGVPAVREQTQEQKAELTQKTLEFNQKLQKLVAELHAIRPDTHFMILDLAKAFEHIINNGSALGYVNTKDTCLDVKETDTSYSQQYSPRAECTRSNGGFIYYDTMHPTTKMHKDIANILTEELTVKLGQ